LLCFSHLRWNFVYQRPQHLMSRFAREFEVTYVEEPVPADGEAHSWLEVRDEAGIRVLVPHLVPGLVAERADIEQRRLLDAHLEGTSPEGRVLWYYTPMS